MSEKLKPCPFCYDFKSSGEDYQPPYIDGFGSFVKCGTCKSSTQTKAISVQGEGQVESLLPRKEAIKAWNTRAKPTFTKEDVEKVVKIILDFADHCDEMNSIYYFSDSTDSSFKNIVVKTALNAIGKVED